MGDRLGRLWDFGDLDVSERRFRAQLKLETSDEGRAEVLTQLARIDGLGGRFSEGEERISQAERLAGSSPIAHVRIHLERGRLLRSAGNAAEALPLFTVAYELAIASGEEFLAADAAHMAALAATDRQGRLEWTRVGMGIAERSADRDVAYWMGPLLNNLGCEYADAGEHEAALEAFQRALEARLRFPENPEAIDQATESVAEELIALGRTAEAQRLLSSR